MNDKHFCSIPDCLVDDCQVLEAAHKEMRGEMIRAGLPRQLIAFKQLETSMQLLMNIDALRYLRMKEMHNEGKG